MLRAPLRALIIGSPGSGKGTLSARLVQHAPAMRTLSAGDVLRAHIRNGTDIGREADGVIRRGGLMPDRVMMGVLSAELEGMGAETPWLLDGFPRTIGQARLLDEKLATLRQPLQLVINLDVPEEVVLSRILDRWLHPASGRVYNMSFNPPKRAGFDDETGEPLEQRPDDNAEAFAARLKAFHREMAPLLDYYRDQRDAPAGERPAYVSLRGEESDIIWPKMWDVVRQYRLQ